MREHLYRGIPKSYGNGVFFGDIWKDNCEGSFVYGSLIVSKDRYYICVSALCQINSCINNGMTSMIEVIPETVGQFTGLTDKNGNEIFEGDIVLYVDEEGYYPEEQCEFVGQIVFESGAFGIGANDNIPIELDFSCENDNFVSLWELYWNLSVDGDELDMLEVIGNIHDNPELLKEGVQ